MVMHFRKKKRQTIVKVNLAHEPPVEESIQFDFGYEERNGITGGEGQG
jgi:hypothetical protein